MSNINGHTELVGLMAYPIRHTQSPAVQSLIYEKMGCNVVQLAFEVGLDALEDSIQAIRSLRMLGTNISMPNKTTVHRYLDEIDPAAELCSSINTIVNLRGEDGKVTGRLKGYNTDGAGFWQALVEEGVEVQGKTLVLIGTGGAATAVAAAGAMCGVSEIHIFNIKDAFYQRGEELCRKLTESTGCKADMNDLADLALLRRRMAEADLFADATGVGMAPLEALSNVPDPSYFRPDLVVCDTVYAPQETVMMKQARDAGCTRVYNGLGMMLYQALIAIELYTQQKIPAEIVAEMKDRLGV